MHIAFIVMHLYRTKKICGATKHMINRDTRLHCKALNREATGNDYLLSATKMTTFALANLVSSSSTLI